VAAVFFGSAVNLPQIRHNSRAILKRMKEIRAVCVRESGRLAEANFKALDSEDLAILFRLYDERFFNQWLSTTLGSIPGSALTFRVSSAMVRPGGKTLRTLRLGASGAKVRHYEIAVSNRMLQMKFGNYYRPLTVCGLDCDDRLSALQRIMEHEMLHLAELLCNGKSSCAVDPFKTMAKSIFGHIAGKHDLITPRDSAMARYGLGIGSRVIFEFDGRKLLGRVNRIQREAVVLVEAEDGVRYQNGKSYKSYSLSPRRLRPVR
jgi:hypothetical protein